MSGQNPIGGTRGSGTVYIPNSSGESEETSEQAEESSEPPNLKSNEAMVRMNPQASDTAKRVESAPTTPDDAPHAYGPPPAAERESNYISDDNLLLWLAQKQDGLYGELRERMDMSRARSKLIEDLSHLKVLLEREATTYAEAVPEIRALLEAYAGTPFEAELQALLRPSMEQMESRIWAEQAVAFFGGTNKLNKELSASIQARVDALGHDDQLELIEIQSLTSDLNQAAQLTSNLLANGNQTANTILGNIGR
jgi:hypothetical protein